MSLAEKIVKIKPEYIWVFLIIVYVIPIVHPLGIPINVSEQPRRIYNRIEQLKAGDVLLYDISGSPAQAAEVEPGNTVIIKHCFSKGAKIIFFSLIVEGPSMYQIYMDNVKPEENFGLKYGEDYAYLGYIAGEEAAQVGMMTNIPNTAPTDYLGNKIEDLPIMAGIKTVDDVKLLLSNYAGAIPSRIRAYSVTGGQTGDKAWVSITTSANVPPVLPYLDSGDVYAVLGGSVQGAEYEILTNFIGNGAKRTDIISMTHLFQILLVVLTNVAYLAARGNGRAK